MTGGGWSIYLGSCCIRPISKYKPYVPNENTLLYLSPDWCYVWRLKDCGLIFNLCCHNIVDYCIWKIFNNGVCFCHCICNTTTFIPYFVWFWSYSTGNPYSNLYCNPNYRNKIYHVWNQWCAIDLWGCTNTFRSLSWWQFFWWTCSWQTPYFIWFTSGSIWWNRSPEWYGCGSSFTTRRCFLWCWCIGDIIIENRWRSVDEINQYVENTKSKYWG